MEGWIMRQVSGPRVGRRPSTTQDRISAVALDLFATHGFDEVSVDDVARAAGIARRTLFRYYPSKNAIPWGDFDAHLNLLRELLAGADPGVEVGEALRTALLEFNRFDPAETELHRQRMRLILENHALQAHSMTMYAGWRGVVAEFVGRRRNEKADALIPQTVAWTLLGVALTAYEQWLADESVSLDRALGDSFDVVGRGLSTL
jgi:TetR/AcrR family transcriptional regulator, regulator of mycofactocin system